MDLRALTNIATRDCFTGIVAMLVMPVGIQSLVQGHQSRSQTPQTKAVSTKACSVTLEVVVGLPHPFPSRLVNAEGGHFKCKAGNMHLNEAASPFSCPSLVDLHVDARHFLLKLASQATSSSLCWLRGLTRADLRTMPATAGAATDPPPLPSGPEPAPFEGSEDPPPTSPLTAAAEEAADAAASRSMSRSPEPQGTGQLAYRAEPVRAATPPDPPLPPEPAASDYDAAVQVSRFLYLSGAPAAHIQMLRIILAARGARCRAFIGRRSIQALVHDGGGCVEWLYSFCLAIDGFLEHMG